MLLLAASLAFGATPHADLHASGGVGGEGALGALVGGSVGMRVHPRFRATARLDGGWFPTGGLGASLRPELRFTATDPQAIWGRFDLVAGLGVRTAGGIGEIGFAGAALDVPGPGGLDLRVEGGYHIDRNGLGAAVLSFGPVFDVRKRVQEPEPPPPEPVLAAEVPPPPAPPASILTDLEDVEVWFPHPICRWLPLDEANALLATMDGAEVQAVAPGHRSQWLDVDGPTPLALQKRLDMGALLVVASPGDQILVDGHEVSTGPDSVLMLATPAGGVDVQIIGNGRRQDLPLVVAPEVTTWARAEEPSTLHVTFPANSAVLSSSGRRQIRAIGEAIGDARFTVEGSFSPEGDLEQNRALASERARAGKQALLDAGVPEDRIDLITEPKQIDSTDWRVLRAAVITPSGLEP